MRVIRWPTSSGRLSRACRAAAAGPSTGPKAWSAGASVTRSSARGDPSQPRPSGGALAYRLFTGVPDYWILLSLASAGLLKLSTLHAPLGAVLAPFHTNPQARVCEEEMPREGIHITRSFHCARWVDGSTHLGAGAANARAVASTRAACASISLSRQS